MSDATQGAGTLPEPPATPADATTQLAQLKADPNFTKPLMAGGPAQLKRFQELHEMIERGTNADVARAMAGEYMGVNTPEHLAMMGAASMLQEAGVRPEIVRDVLAGTHTVTAAEYALVKQFKADKMTDKEWTKRLFAGDSEARRQFHLMNVVLTGNVRGEKAA
jgi:hypothetical protein